MLPLLRGTEAKKKGLKTLERRTFRPMCEVHLDQLLTEKFWIYEYYHHIILLSYYQINVHYNITVSACVSLI